MTKTSPIFPDHIARVSQVAKELQVYCNAAYEEIMGKPNVFPLKYVRARKLGVRKDVPMVCVMIEGGMWVVKSNDPDLSDEIMDKIAVSIICKWSSCISALFELASSKGR